MTDPCSPIQTRGRTTASSPQNGLALDSLQPLPAKWSQEGFEGGFPPSRFFRLPLTFTGLKIRNTFLLHTKLLPHTRFSPSCFEKAIAARTGFWRERIELEMEQASLTGGTWSPSQNDRTKETDSEALPGTLPVSDFLVLAHVGFVEIGWAKHFGFVVISVFNKKIVYLASTCWLLYNTEKAYANSSWLPLPHSGHFCLVYVFSWDSASGWFTFTKHHRSHQKPERDVRP